MTNDFLTEVTLKSGEATYSMLCDMSLTEEAVDFMFRLLIMSGHHQDNVASSMIEIGNIYLKDKE
jgi:hypothetical protein